MEEPTGVLIRGKTLRCPHCDGTKFFEREYLLNTAGMTFLELDWLNQSAKNYVCSRCGRIEWFLPLPQVEASSTRGDIDCFECGSPMPDGTVKCSKCGWSYQAEREESNS